MKCRKSRDTASVDIVTNCKGLFTPRVGIGSLVDAVKKYIGFNYIIHT